MVEIIKDIAYAAQSATQKLDVYLPDRKDIPYPVIVWLHPGGYTTGDKDMIQPFVNTMISRGYAAVSINYRLADETRFPDQIYDAKAAIRWVRANAKTYHFNPDKIASWGISAGTTFAALLGTTGNIKELEELSMGNATESSKVNAVVAWYGPMDFTTLESQHVQLGHKIIHDEISGISLMLGGQISEIPENYKAASPMTYINSECPPFYIQHGKSDELIPYLQSVTFANALIAAIGKSNVKLNLIENVGHFDSVHKSSENVKLVLDFLDEYLR